MKDVLDLAHAWVDARIQKHKIFHVQKPSCKGGSMGFAISGGNQHLCPWTSIVSVAGSLEDFEDGYFDLSECLSRIGITPRQFLDSLMTYAGREAMFGSFDMDEHILQSKYSE